ncbi:GntR family transcriptional regulator [Curtobacterium ammoniigenes]|uniref:GntR family transcriptional regulator n=1 Tax=Curtobacterium ammoniigenes TaxID=395387 RepID=UPI00082A9F66|nr:GntR family transcriptional regulator [Curtobacterium ammoniigenes]
MITVDLAEPVPPYEQIRAQLAAQITGGALAAGTRLPTVRRLAADLGLATNTVARAYKALELAGLVTTGRRAGTVVAVNGDTVRQEAHAAARAFADRMRALGIDRTEALTMIDASFSS